MTAPDLAIPTEHGRFYRHPGSGAQVPSITNIINMKSKPLFKAGLRKAADFAADNREMLAGIDRESAYRLVADPPNKPDEPAGIGDIVHAWAEADIRSRMSDGLPATTPADFAMAPRSAKWMWERWGPEFIEVHKPEFTGAEFTVWSEKYGYAGTADFSAMMYGAHSLVDIKTGKRPYPEVAMQLAAIQNADFMLAPDGTESPIPRYDRYGVLHMRPRSCRLHPVYEIEAAFEGFLHLKGIFDWNIHYAPRSIGFVAK